MLISSLPGAEIPTAFTQLFTKTSGPQLPEHRPKAAWGPPRRFPVLPARWSVHQVGPDFETSGNLAGELVLGRNQLRASIAQKNSRALKAADLRINQIR